MSSTLTLKTFSPIAVMSLTIVLIFALTPGFTLISITIPYTSWTVEGYWLWFSVASVLPLTDVQFALKLTIPSFPSNWANLGQTPSKGPSSCSDSALWAAVMSWGYVYPHIIIQVVHRITQLLAKPMKRQSLKCSWTSLALNILGYSCCTAFSVPSNQVIYSVTFSIFPCSNL